MAYDQRHHALEEVGVLVQTVFKTEDPMQLCLAASKLRSHLIGETLPAQALKTLDEAARVIVERLCDLVTVDAPGGTVDPSSELLATLRDLVYHVPSERTYVRSELMSTGVERGEDDKAGLLSALQAFISGTYDAGERAMTFVHACDLLTVLAEGDSKLCWALRAANFTELVTERLLVATCGRDRSIPYDEAALALLPPQDRPIRHDWSPFAVAAVGLLEALVLEQELDILTGIPVSLTLIVEIGGQPSKTRVLLDALLASLERSLLSQGGHIAVQQLHISCLRTLGQVLRICRRQVFLSPSSASQQLRQPEPALQHVLASGGLVLAVQVLNLAGRSDERATAVALWFLAELAEGAREDRDHQEALLDRLLAANGVASVTRAADWYPSSGAVRQEAGRFLEACRGGGVEAAEAAALAAPPPHDDHREFLMMGPEARKERLEYRARLEQIGGGPIVRGAVASPRRTLPLLLS